MGIFDNDTDLFTTYRATLAFRDKIMAGIPGDPSLVEDWIKTHSHASTSNEIMHERLKKNLREMGADQEDVERLDEADEKSFQEVYDEIVAKLAAQKQTNVFKRNGGGLYMESRKVKAMIKEVCNVLWPGERWGSAKDGRFKKGPKYFMAERAFVRPNKLYLNRSEPDGVELFVGHVVDKTGPKSTLTYYQYVEGAELNLYIMLTPDAVDEMADRWPRFWVHSQENGLGALRSQGHGKFDITAFDKVDELPDDAGEVPEVAAEAEQEHEMAVAANA